MIVRIASAALSAMFAFSNPIAAHDYPAHSQPVHARMVIQNSPILVSCYRGPWEQVIWDRPNPEFVESLVRAGYRDSTAYVIGERICRDQSLVGHPERARARMMQVLRSTPFDRK